MKVSYLPTIARTWMPTTISFNDYLARIIDNPRKKEIEYLRTLPYGSKAYKKYKKKLPAVKIHGEFKGISDSDLLELNNYLYFDIDDLTDSASEAREGTEEMIPPKTLNDTKQQLIDLNICAYIFTSIGGKGLSILVHVPQLTSLTKINIEYHKRVWLYIKDTYLANFKIDLKAYSLSRNLLITSDPELHYKEVVLNVDQMSIDNFISSFSFLNKKSSTSSINRGERRIQYGVNDTFQIIPYKELLKQIVTKTQYEKEITGGYIVDPIEYQELFIPKNIFDGTKHRIYAGIVNKLVVLNPTITFEQTISFMMVVNEHAQPPMEYHKLRDNVYYWHNVAQNNFKTGALKSKTRIKKIHFNREMSLSARQKQSIASKAIGRERTNKSIEKINEAKIILGDQGTQRAVAELTGLSIATVKRNWTKHKMDVNCVEIDSNIAWSCDNQYDILDQDVIEKSLDSIAPFEQDNPHCILPNSESVNHKEHAQTKETDDIFDVRLAEISDEEFWK